MEAVPVDFHADGTVGGGLGGFDPSDAVDRLGVDEEMLVTWLLGIGTDAG